MKPLVLVLLLLCGCTTNFSLLPQKPAEPFGGIPNFFKVDEGVYRGAQPLKSGFDYLKSIGVKTIYKLNLDSEGSDTYSESIGIKVVRLPITDWDQIIGPPPVAQMKALVLQVKPGSFIHCGSTERTTGSIYKKLKNQGGQDRTGLFVFYYRLGHGWTYSVAREEALGIGFHRELHGLNEAMENEAKSNKSVRPQ